MPRPDNPNGDAPRAEVSVVELPGTPLAPDPSETAAATAPADAADGLPPDNVGKSSDSEELIPASVWTTELPFLAGLALALLSVLGLLAAWVNDDTQPWLAGHIQWVLVGYGTLFAVMILVILAWWSKRRGPAVRAAALILVGFPAILIALASVLFVVPVATEHRPHAGGSSSSSSLPRLCGGFSSPRSVQVCLTSSSPIFSGWGFSRRAGHSARRRKHERRGFAVICRSSRARMVVCHRTSTTM